MRFGVFIFPTDTAIRPDVIAREVEGRGFESLWFPEHSHIPTSRVSPWGGGADAPPLPEHYWHTHHQMVAMAYAAAATDRLLIGSGITLIAQRDPIWTAKEIASLDQLSGGRILVGIGYGWNKEEMAHHGVAYTERRALLREKMLMMQALWTQDEASYEGEKLKLESSWAWPKPAQKPHPPIIMGAAIGPKTISHIVEFCDGWIPMAVRHDIKGKIERVREAVAESGRDPAGFQVTVYGAKLDALDSLVEAGVDRVVFTMPPLDESVVIPRLDRFTEAIASFVG